VPLKSRTARSGFILYRKETGGDDWKDLPLAQKEVMTILLLLLLIMMHAAAIVIVIVTVATDLVTSTAIFRFLLCQVYNTRAYERKPTEKDSPKKK